jgi:hypothetical protein
MKIKAFTILTWSVFLAYLVSAQGRVEPGTCIKVESGTTVDVGSGNLILGSDAMGDASLLDYGTVSYSGGGKAEVQRYLTAGHWHLVSSPVSSALSGMFLADYLQEHSESTNGWSNIVPVNLTLIPMQGYALWSVEAVPTTEVFSGSTNTGTLNKSFTQSGEGWNLVGNPYPSALDWDAVMIPAQLSGAIWIFDPSIGTNGDYRYYINGGGAGNTTTPYIPSGQGFFIRATGGPSAITLDNTSRVHNGQVFYKSNENETILVLSAKGNEITTQTAIRFNENATQQVDRLYDVYKLFTESPDVPVIYTKSENENLAINTLSAITGNEVVPVWFRVGMDGEYIINATQLETFDISIPVYLQDIETGMLQDLRQNQQYNFSYKTGTDKAFLVYFTDPKTFVALKSDIRIYAESSNLHVDFPVSYLAHPDFTASILVFDVNGKKILQTETGSLNNLIPIAGRNNLYVVKVITSSETTNGKVIIN